MFFDCLFDMFFFDVGIVEFCCDCSLYMLSVTSYGVFGVSFFYVDANEFIKGEKDSFW